MLWYNIDKFYEQTEFLKTLHKKQAKPKFEVMFDKRDM